ncbi:gliding motility protein GldM [Flaviaesturariibacter flavus]|uniref:Gliding motility protein GldM n=1 Tax=Flaviaesturariibacter flavus TaxID=2502780 RepID=A0A4R1BBF5_9BACT|nr:gliding motility protein GldM [Flaviaesturariibacter flavus]TCJ14268.1 gliding motility protein GldM [Flaviaesturariibacter flavus]
MALPKEPRQKMINLMYLVLTALLALNVSAEILNAFRTVDNSLQKTNATVNASTEQIIASLQEKISDPSSRAKAEIWLPKAQNAQAMSKDMFNYIQQLRAKILTAADFDPKRIKDGKPDSSFRADNLDIATRIMVEEGEGKKLFAKLREYRDRLLAIDPLIAKEFANSLQIDLNMPVTQDKSNKTLEAAYFHMVPTVAAITILSKFQNDVKTSENKVVAFCHEQVGKVTVRYDTFAAIVGQNTNYVMPGQEIEINAGVGAFSKAAAPQITINGQGAPLGADGQATLKVAGGGLGKHSVPVVIRFQDQDGKMQTVTKNIEYTVGQANASIALDKMNVLYIGVDNPVTIAASGGGDDRISASISNGSITKVSAGKYNVRVNNQSDDTKITVTVDGKVAGISSFRVRNIPDPIAQVGSYPSGENVNAGAFKAQAGVAAYIKDFPFDIKYQVTSFTLTADNAEGDIEEAPCTGNTWSPKAQSIIRGLAAGRTVTIDGIRAIGPDGRTRKLPSLVYYIK